ncbi:MAG: peptidase [Pirellulaceae bacterium]
MPRSKSHEINTAHAVDRRQFLAAGAIGAAATIAAPAIVTASKTDTKTIVGEGDYRYEVEHAWPQLPDKFTWQTTHNVAIDRDGNLYVIHEGQENQKDHPSIFVFDAEGRYVRSFGSQFQGGGHGLEVRQEGNDQFLYVSAYQQLKTFAKLDLKGEVVWQKYAPMQSGVYADGEDTKPQKVWGRDRFMPTNFAFLDDGGFLLADGYGSYVIHRYDKDANWQSCFGGAGNGQGKFATPHGLWIDRRPGREPAVVVTDRAHHTLQYLTLDGQYMETIEGFGLPANADTWNDLLMIPELLGRVTLLDAKNRVVARLCDDADRVKADKDRALRRTPADWQDGRFVHPHDACFDANGNIYVAEWVATGRVSRLKRLA